jgi:hypothetical protein
MADLAESEHLEFKREGFRIYWDKEGLKIEVTDYHPEILHLSWETIAGLAKRAKPPGAANLGGKSILDR